MTPKKIVKLIIIITLLVTIYRIAIRKHFRAEDRAAFPKPNSVVSPITAIKSVIVHLDLKGAAPKLAYLKTLLPTLKRLGVTGLLIEYEDVFPYEGQLMKISARNAYRRKELEDFLLTVNNEGLESIPLVQTFGHLEYILKHRQYADLREVVTEPGSICPSHERSLLLIEDIINQVVRFHQRIAPLRRFHIGSDEVYMLNRCPICRKKNIPSSELYMNHIRNVIKIVEKINANLTVLMWDDHLREQPPSDEIFKPVSHNVVPVIWSYQDGAMDKVIPQKVIYKYSKYYNSIWVSSAFKGADGPEASYPDLKKRYKNHMSWLNFLKINSQFKGVIPNFNGLILTGWSRYSHFKPLCEFLPTALPSLILNLILIKTFLADSNSPDLHMQVLQKFKNEINCTDEMKHIDIIDDDFQYVDAVESTIPDCKFYKDNIYDVLQTFTAELKGIVESVNDKRFAQAEYYLKVNRLAYSDLVQMEDQAYDNLRRLKTLKASVNYALNVYYDNSTIDEYLAYKTYFYEKILLERISLIRSSSVFHFRVWDRV